MNSRQQFVYEIEAACDELKHAGIPHAIDLAKHIVRMKRELNFYDKCHAMNNVAKSSGGEVSAECKEP